MSLTAKEAKEKATQKHHIYYKCLFNRNVQGIDRLIEKKIEMGLFKCQICNRYNNTSMTFLEYPTEKDKWIMIQEIKTYYTNLGFIIDEEDDILTIKWGDD